MMKSAPVIIVLLFLSFAGSASAADTIYVPSFAVSDRLYKINTVSFATECSNSTAWASEGCCLDPLGYVWVANTGAGSVTRIRASDCAVMGTFVSAGDQPISCCVDEDGNIWYGNGNGHTVQKRRGSDGALLGTFSTGGLWPSGSAADGRGHVWFVTHFGDRVMEFSLDGTLLGTYNPGYDLHEGIAVDLDGNVWVAATYRAIKLDGTSGEIIYSTYIDGVPRSCTCSGAFVWYPCQLSYDMHKVRVADGELVGSYPIGTIPFGCAVDHDGYIWVTCNNGSVRKFDPDSGSYLGAGHASSSTISVGDMTGFAWDTFVNGGERTPTPTPSPSPTSTITPTPSPTGTPPPVPAAGPWFTGLLILLFSLMLAGWWRGRRT